jgi:hypothetical protein
MKALYALTLAAIIILTSCVTYRLLPLEDPYTSIKYNRGTPVLHALNDRIGVAVSSQVHGGRIYFQLIVRNFTEGSLHLDDASARLSERDATDIAPGDVRIYRAEEYYQLRRNEILTGQVLMTVAAAMSTANAGRSTSYSRGYYTTYGHTRNSYYRGYGSYSATIYSYDSAKAAMEREIAFSNVRAYINGSNAELDYLQNTLFYPSDIDANGEYFGIIVAELGKTENTEMSLSLDFGGAPFRFAFQKQQISYGAYQE